MVLATDFMRELPKGIDAKAFFEKKVDCYLGNGMKMRNVISSWSARFALGHGDNKSTWLDIEDLELVLNNLLKGECE